MASQTDPKFAYTTNANGESAVVALTYDDVTFLITQIVITNNSLTQSVFVQATSTSNGKVYSATVPPGPPFPINVPTNQANKLQLKVDADNPNRLDGVEWQVRFV
jgi:hypothetical protein